MKFHPRIAGTKPDILTRVDWFSSRSTRIFAKSGPFAVTDTRIQLDGCQAVAPIDLPRIEIRILIPIHSHDVAADPPPIPCRSPLSKIRVSLALFVHFECNPFVLQTRFRCKDRRRCWSIRRFRFSLVRRPAHGRRLYLGITNAFVQCAPA